MGNRRWSFTQTGFKDCRGIGLCTVETRGLLPPTLTERINQGCSLLLLRDMGGGEVFLKGQVRETVATNLALQEQATHVLNHLKKGFGRHTLVDATQRLLEKLLSRARGKLP